MRSLTRALRTLLEVTSLNMLVRRDARQSREDLLDLNLSLPFQSEVNTGFGVLAKVYLDALTHINNKEDPIPTVPGMFLSYVHPAGEVHITDAGAWEACPGGYSTAPRAPRN